MQSDRTDSLKRTTRRLLHVAAFLAVVMTAGTAQAKFFEVWARGQAGYVTGNGKTDRDFFNWAGGAGFGFEIGAKVLFISAFIDYLRFAGGDTGANLVGFNLGYDGSFSFGAIALDLRGVGVFYVGTLDDATRPLDNGTDVIPSERVQTRGIGVRGGAGLRYTFFKVFALGVMPEIGYHYFFGGANDNAADTAQNSSGWDFRVMGFLRIGLGF